MKKIAASLALIALVGVSVPQAFAIGYATAEIHPSGDIHTGDTLTVTNKYGDDILLCFSDVGWTGFEECGGLIGIDSSPKDLTQAMLNFCNALSTNSDFENVTCDPLEGGARLTATEPGPGGADINVGAALFNGGAWNGSHLIYTADPPEPSGGWFHLGTGVTTGTLATVSGAFANRGTLTLVGLAAGFPLTFYFLGELIRMYDRRKAGTGAPVAKNEPDALTENRRILARIHDLWPGHDDHSSYI